MGVLKDLLQIQPDLKLICMSATMDVEKFSNYFDGAPIIRIPTSPKFPTEHFFLEDFVADIKPDGGFLELSILDSYQDKVESPEQDQNNHHDKSSKGRYNQNQNHGDIVINWLWKPLDFKVVTKSYERLRTRI